MGTKFSDIYNLATFRITDYAFLNLGNQDVKEEALGHFLLAAISDFQNSCPDYDLTDYDDKKEYPAWNIELPNEVQQILALGVVYHWMEMRTLSTKLMKNLVHSTKYSSYSPANLLSQMSSVKEDLYKEYQGKMYRYSYYHGDIKDRKV